MPDGSARLLEGADGTGCDELGLADAAAATDAADDECVEDTVGDFVVDVVVGGV